MISLILGLYALLSINISALIPLPIINKFCNAQKSERLGFGDGMLSEGISVGRNPINIAGKEAF